MVRGALMSDLFEGVASISTAPARLSRIVRFVNRLLIFVGAFFLSAACVFHKNSRHGYALTKTIQRLPQQLRRSLTWDRGIEMNRHKDFTIATNVQVYFCDPLVLGNEVPTRTPMDCFASTSPKEPIYQCTRRHISNKIARKLNQRPRETLGFDTPAEKLRRVLRRPPDLEPQKILFNAWQGWSLDHRRRCDLDEFRFRARRS